MRDALRDWGPEHCSVTVAARAPFNPQQGRDAEQHHILSYREPYHTLCLKKNPFLFQEFIILVLPNSNPDIHLIQLIHNLSTPRNDSSSTEQQ